MRSPLGLLSLGILTLGAAACGGDDGAGPGPTQLTGSWQATKAEFVSLANPALKVDLIQQGGTVQLVLSEANSYALTIAEIGEPSMQHTGTWSASGDVLTLNLSPPLAGEMQFDMTLSGSTLTLAGGHLPFSFTGDVFEEAVLTLILTKE